MLGETLRLEVAPFDVKVLTIVTGAVATPFMAKAEDPQLVSGSHYHVVENEIRAAAKDSDSRKRTPSDQYAEQVVGDILGGVTGKTYRGKQAALVKYLIPYLPMWLFVSIQSASVWRPRLTLSSGSDHAGRQRFAGDEGNNEEAELVVVVSVLESDALLALLAGQHRFICYFYLVVFLMVLSENFC